MPWQTSGWIAALAAAGFAGVAFADSTAPPKAFQVASPNGAFVLRMTPPAEPDASGHGRVYRSGGEEALWSVGWYARRVFVSDDGRRVIRLDPAPERLGDLALGIYAREAPPREWSLDELVEAPEMLERTTSHIPWLAADPEPGFSADGRRFEVATREGRRLAFDLDDPAPPTTAD